MTTSKTGIWIDDVSGEVVTSPPHTGTQLVAKGGEISKAARARAEILGVAIPEDDDAETAPATDPPGVFDDENAGDGSEADAGDRDVVTTPKSRGRKA